MIIAQAKDAAEWGMFYLCITLETIVNFLA